MEMKIEGYASSHSLRFEVGPANAAGGFEFGMSAEVHLFLSSWEESPKAEVSFAAIGSHTPEVARVRCASYAKATAIAEQVQKEFDAGLTDLEQLRYTVLESV